MITKIKTAEQLKQFTEQEKKKFADMVKPSYPTDYRERELYKQFKTEIESATQLVRNTHHSQQISPMVPDFGCDTANATYLQVLALLDECDSICGFNCDDYPYENLGEAFEKIRNTMKKRIDAGLQSTEKQWANGNPYKDK